MTLHLKAHSAGHSRFERLCSLLPTGTFVVLSVTVVFFLPVAGKAQDGQVSSVQQKMPTVLPLSGPSFILLESADEALSNKDYDQAVAKLEEAIRQRPDSLRLRVALIDALYAAGKPEQARETALQGTKDAQLSLSDRSQLSAIVANGDQKSQPPSTTGFDTNEVSQQAQNTGERALSQSNPAYSAADSAYHAYSNGAYQSAVESAKEAVRLAPDNEAYKTLLSNAQTALAQHKQLGTVSAISAGNRVADAAYAALRNGNTEKALTDAKQAVRLAPGNRSFRALLIETQNRVGNKQAALAAANDAIEALGPDRQLLRERGAIKQALGDNIGARNDFALALSESGSGTSERQLRLDLANAALDTAEPALAYDTLKPLGDDKNSVVWLRRGVALTAMDDYTAADTALKQAVARADTPRETADVVNAQLDLAAASQGKRQARAMFEDARAQGMFSTFSPTETAYLAARLGDNKLAYADFKTAYEQGNLRGSQLIDAAYAARRSYHNSEAIALLKQAIDEADAGVFELNTQQRFDLRREISDLSRRWGANVALSYGSSGISDGYLTPPASAGQVTQLGTEVYWRPPVIGYRDGRTVDLFLRQFTTLSDSLNGPIGTSTMQGAFGIRVKPFTRSNFVIEGARYFKIGQYSRNDYLLRAAISGGFGGDLNPVDPSWWVGSYFGEVGRYFESNQNFSDGSAQFGRSYRLGGDDGKLVITPFLGISADYNNTLKNVAALGAGPGFNLRYWFRETKYEAPMSHIDLSTQYRVKLAGDDRAQGWFATLSLSF